MQAREAIFIDDEPENVVGAENVGLCGIQYTDTAAVKERTFSQFVFRMK